MLETGARDNNVVQLGKHVAAFLGLLLERCDTQSLHVDGAFSRRDLGTQQLNLLGARVAVPLQLMLQLYAILEESRLHRRLFCFLFVERHRQRDDLLPGLGQLSLQL